MGYGSRVTTAFVSQPVRSVRYLSATQVGGSTQARHDSAAQVVSLEFTHGTCELGVWYNLSSQVLSIATRKKFGRHCYADLCVELPICVAERYPTLRICLGMGAHCAPLRKKKSSAVPPFRSGHMSAICARPFPKEVGVKRVETLVSTLLPRRGARRIPAESQRKTPRPLGANTPTAVRVPRSAGAEKGCRPEGANPLTQFAPPRTAGAEKEPPGKGEPPVRFRSPVHPMPRNEKTPFIKRLYNI